MVPINHIQLSPIRMTLYLSNSNRLLCPHFLHVPEERNAALLTNTPCSPLRCLLPIRNHVPHPHLVVVIGGDELTCVVRVEKGSNLAPNINISINTAMLCENVKLCDTLSHLPTYNCYIATVFCRFLTVLENWVLK